MLSRLVAQDDPGHVGCRKLNGEDLVGELLDNLGALQLQVTAAGSKRMVLDQVEYNVDLALS